VVRVVEIPARHGAALEVARGLVLRVIDVEGQQVGDFYGSYHLTSLGDLKIRILTYAKSEQPVA
jgi:uncharacterized protein YcgI (DUF1989 family)